MITKLNEKHVLVSTEAAALAPSPPPERALAFVLVVATSFIICPSPSLSLVAASIMLLSRPSRSRPALRPSQATTSLISGP